ncbi:hypothetical protein GCM10009715_25550 [Paeniglutamicibacter psychrophenolicus]|uniref:Uncharacterized protein n=1 Tax=Paeniglutamicibacter psychrophenolicus TaxID=257454 RepID=A0ABS4WEE3_9MICC|nr:hypothetical protein [Paeniglutamicibacter psychrophenolicus]MBP2374508.1 hypothetical protein [Paeniglutamicibacter psychrophenolicus]
MSATNKTGQPELAIRLPKASVFGFLAAAVLFLASAVLQHLGSIQRWVVLRGQRPGNELSVEDHLLDYSFPADPWEPIGTAAQLFGAGTLLQALGVLAMAVGVLAVPRVAPNRIGIVTEPVLALLVAAAFAVLGAHALISGINAAPSDLQHSSVLLPLMVWGGLGGMVALAWLWAGMSKAASVACVFLLGSNMFGGAIANFTIAAMIAGYVSHDTTPWLESVVAGSTAAAALAMIFAAGTVVRRYRHAE